MMATSPPNPLMHNLSLWPAGEEYVRASNDTPVATLPTQTPAHCTWPVGTLTEVRATAQGSSDLGLVLPALAHLARQQRWLAWVAPPYLPSAATLASLGIDVSRILLIHPKAAADGLWAVEQALRSGTCGAVLAWLSHSDAEVQARLQRAAEAGRSWGILFRSF
jgi:cell division inhibitor SulA